MKKILIRGGMSPFENQPIEDVIAYNRIGDNVGNLVYLYSIYRTLMVDDVEIVPTYYRTLSLDIDRINQECSAFVLPLADAIRNSFVGELQRLTQLINKLSIPCYLLGVGIRAPYNYEKNGISFKYDDLAYDFFKAVLNKSGMVGVRGEITADYLKKLGFVPETDYTVIGCPSLYGFGNDLKVRPVNVNKESNIAINNTVMAGEAVQRFLRGICDTYENHFYFPQRINELKTYYLGEDYKHLRKCIGYPDTVRDKLYTGNKIKMYMHVYDWINELAKMSVSIGPRLHGNVAAVLAGTPAVWIMHDARMRELVDYHKLPHIAAKDIGESDTLKTVLSRVDCLSISNGHKQRFEHYVDFLDKIGLNHIFKDYNSLKESRFDLEINTMHKDMNNEIISVWSCSKEELIDRHNAVIDAELKRQNKNAVNDVYSESDFLREQILDLKEQIKLKNEELKDTKRELREARRSLWYIFKRKIRNLINRFKMKDSEE